ncbi:MAG: YeeE/YedE thiosulfate transporter family protein [Candidatus Kariarchaeaceae archaeon]
MSDKTKNENVFVELYEKLFSKHWPMMTGAIILSLLSTVLFAILKAWGQSGGVNYWGQALFGFHDFDFLAHPYSILGVTTFLGALASAFFAKEFKLSIPPYGELIKGLVGGLLMGVGAILGTGCTLGSYYTGIPQLSGGALIFTLGLFIGVYAAVWYLSWEVDAYPGISDAKKAKVFEVSPENKFVQPLLGLLVLVGGVLLAYSFDETKVYPFSGTSAVLGTVLVAYAMIGLIIGFVLQRSQFCTVRSIRDPFMTGNATAAVAIIVGILVALVSFTTLMYTGFGGIPIAAGRWFVFDHFWAPAIIGGLIFGFGMTLAGGCVMGSLWRSGEGQTKNWLAVLGIAVGAALTTEYIKDDFYDALNHEVIYLPDKFDSHILAILFVLVILALWYWAVKWNERTEKLVVE